MLIDRIPMLKFRVHIVLAERMLGSQPMMRDVLSQYVAAKGPRPEEEVAALPDDLQEKHMTGFPRHSVPDGSCVFIWDYQVKGFIKEAARNTQSLLQDRYGTETAGTGRGRRKGVSFANPASHIDREVFVLPRRIYLYHPDGYLLLSPSGVLERPLRAMTMQGPRVSLVGSEYVDAGTSLDFYVHVVDGSAYANQEAIETLFSYGSLFGLGQWRTGGNGVFDLGKSSVETVKSSG